MARVFLVVIDSVGIGGAPDAAEYFNGATPDTGANTLGHIAEACTQVQDAARPAAKLHVPNLARLGLWHALALANDEAPPKAATTGQWGAATETSKGKDTPSGHWELAGLPVPWEWHYFPNAVPTFPESLIDAACRAAGTDGILGNCHASGTAIIEELGAEHIRTGWPICYTSADSVFQIAAHEEHFGLERLLAMCQSLAPQLHEMRVGRVIARPFVGAEGEFARTSNRRDYAAVPPGPVLSQWVQQAGRRVYAVGKIGDIFSMQGFDELRKGSDVQLMQHLGDLIESAEDGSLTFANFVEFDSLYGHRRDVPGYARHLEWFDRALGALLDKLQPGDMLLVTADHGNDPTWVGTDHTRERVPVLIAGQGLGQGAGSLGHLGFCDVAYLVAQHLDVPPKGALKRT